MARVPMAADNAVTHELIEPLLETKAYGVILTEDVRRPFAAHEPTGFRRTAPARTGIES